ncbi:MAG TPA: cell division protein ZapA [Xanthobacteraceae bacterium]|jgi:cell division protein ZapA|nr:cell division protein ZapA [Xanthobacteraceae bacterium]
MAHVSVTINGRQYRMACEDGQEEHLMRLGSDLDMRIQRLRKDFGEIGDMRLIVMAALTVADELDDAGKQLQRVEEQFSSFQNARVAAADRTHATQAALAAALNSAAERIESATTTLNQKLSEGITEGIVLG